MNHTDANRQVGTDFTEGEILPLLLRFAGPFLLANILNNLYNTVDMVVIGQFAGSSGTVAVSQGGKMLNVYTMACMGLAGAGQILIGQEIGAKLYKKVSVTIGTMISTLEIAAFCLAFITFALSAPIVRWLNTPEEVIPQTLAYLRITSVGLPLIFGYEAVSAVLRGMGNSKGPLAFVAVATGLNIILDILFIVVFDMGAAGTALATVIGQGVSFLLAIAALYRHRESMGLEGGWKLLRISKSKLKILLRLGIPMAASNGMIQISQVVMMGMVNQYGVVQAAAFGVGDKILTIASVFNASTQTAGGAMVAQNFGAGKLERIKKLVYSCFGVSLLATLLLAGVSAGFPNAIFGIFTKDPQVMAYSGSFMKIAILLYFLATVQGAYQSVVVGTGNAALSFAGSFIDSILLRLGLGVFFGRYLGLEVVGFFLGTVLARLGPITISSIYYYSGYWKTYKKLVEKQG